MSLLIGRVVSIFLLLLVGFSAKKIKVIDGAFVRTLSGFILNITLPFMIIASFDRNIPRSAIGELGIIFLWALGIHLVSIAIATLMYKNFPAPERKILSYVTVFSNCGFMGFPLVESIFGKHGLMYASIYVVVFTIVLWTYGISLFVEKKGAGTIKKVMFNPGNISTVIGIVIWFLPWDLPAPIRGAIQLMAPLTTPLSMILVGATLADIPRKGLLRGKSLWLGSAMRLVFIPLIVFASIKISGSSGYAPEVSFVLVAMPAAAQSVIFAERYGGDVSLASRLVFVTTVLSIVTVPMFAGLVT